MSDKKVDPRVNVDKVYRPAQNNNEGVVTSQNSYQGPTSSGEPKNPPSSDSASSGKED
ncbi:hypothetical protein [Lutimaribacter pacificus]|uniref:hypothetical protein n=1 Tax=Lutimaribacter pacificus TaxID=391948 RepID=UPI00165FC334|nr:hypothetical protein [Lutimaribacter pacificus]